ncbi:MAG TPA: ADP-glyceromanno-heptose 6-epimerase [Opitutales bacterium]|jgi:ADP-L-glycero-D-manno-heptose 6-epimerase|nr:ADP-glyceromanno-heptose 6-epimerase [Opitutales bacterium]
MPTAKKFASPFANGRVLVTGGAGFIGSALIWALNQQGVEDILVADFLGTDDKYLNLVPLRFADYLEADRLLAGLDGGEPQLKNVRWVFHLGACSATTERDVRYLMQNNYEYTRALAQWSLKNKSRFVYASSAATYGDGAEGMDDQNADLHRLRPLNPYGYSKHLFDLHAQHTGMLDRIVGLKYFNVFGPNEGHKGDMRSVVHKAFQQIQSTGRVQLFKSHHPDYPDGGQKRDFLYVKDAVAMTLHLAANPQAGGLFNIGSGKAHTWLELVAPIFAALDRPQKIEFIDMPEVLRAKYQYFTQANTSKLRANGYTAPITPLAAAVIDYVRNYLTPGHRLGDEAATPVPASKTPRRK